jgi:hypothetical protein
MSSTVTIRDPMLASLLTGQEGYPAIPYHAIPRGWNRHVLQGTKTLCRILHQVGIRTGSLAAIQARVHASVGIQETRKRGSI